MVVPNKQSRHIITKGRNDEKFSCQDSDIFKPLTLSKNINSNYPFGSVYSEFTQSYSEKTKR